MGAKLGHLVHATMEERTTTTGSPSSYHRDYANHYHYANAPVHLKLRIRSVVAAAVVARVSLTWDVDGVQSFVISRNICRVCLNPNLHRKKVRAFILVEYSGTSAERPLLSFFPFYAATQSLIAFITYIFLPHRFTKL
jgi:hypothetical protein